MFSATANDLTEDISDWEILHLRSQALSQASDDEAFVGVFAGFWDLENGRLSADEVDCCAGAADIEVSCIS